jgi:pilus assembly protein FimV
MLSRILVQLTFLAALAIPLSALALGVGPIEVRSALNQNFEADIPLIINNPVELTGLAVRIPRQQDFDQNGVERLELLSTLKFAIPKPGEPPVIKVTSQEPIREPNFDLLLEVVWPRGRLFREFPVHLDPELYVNRRQPPPPAPVLSPPPVMAAAPTAVVPVLPPAPPVSFEGASLYPVKPGETLRAVANRVRPSTAISLPQMMAILLAGNPEAFANGNPNILRAGATLKVPTPQALGLPGVASPPPALATAPSPNLATPSAEPGTTLPAPPISLPAPITDSIPPPTATTPVIPPTSVSVTLAPLPSPTEPPKEIIPQASAPQPEPVSPPVAAAPPEPVKPAPVAAAPPEPVKPAPVAVASPEPVKPAPAVKPSPAIETEAIWMDNPVVWIAMVLIVLAVAAMSLLPLLRRTVRTKPAAAGPGRAGTRTGAADSLAQLQDSQPRTRRAPPAAELAAVSALTDPASPRPTPAASLGPRPAAASTPRPIDELLKDIDFGLGTEQLSNLAGGKGAKPASAGIAPPRLPDAEPPTSSITPVSKPEIRPAPPPIKFEARTPPAMSSQVTDLPSDFRLDGMDFDFGDLSNSTTRSVPEELPPLEIRPAAAHAKPVDWSPLTLDTFEPLTEPHAMGAAQAVINASSVPDAPAAPPVSQKFEFSDVSQDYQAIHDDSFRLDEELMGISGGSLDLGQMDLEISSGGGAPGADFVETKLDLATAYLEMGDQVGARSLLEDVLREGDNLQKNRAGELLKKLG